MIYVQDINKSFKVAKRQPGLKNAITSFFSREYTTINALNDISFNIDEGEIVGYIGPNGAGKSTTIKIMSGVLVPDSGKCQIMGHIPWKERINHVKNIGVVFGQRSQLWWDIPVCDSFELLKDIYKVNENQYKKNLDLLIETLDISEIINTPVRQLSLGQRMRCEIAASLIHSPKVLFLDEPTIGLDSVSKIAVRNFIKTINKERNMTVILTTHDMQDIEALTNRILLIGKGQLLYDGSLSHLSKDYVSKETIIVDYSENTTCINIDGAKILSQNNQRAVLEIDLQKTNVSKVLSQLIQQFDIHDLTVESQPLDQTIAKIYKEYAL